MRHQAVCIQPGRWLDTRRAVYLEPQRVLAVADLHWGYAASHRALGNLLPDWGDEAIARTLDALIAEYEPAEMIWLGDSVHDAPGRHAAEAYLARCPVPVVLIPGNHDRRWAMPKERTVRRGEFLFHHGDAAVEVPADMIEVIGHFHPAFSWYDGAGARFKLPGLVCGPRRWILPAFSPWAAGTPWNHELTEEESLWVISPRRIFAVTPQLLRQQRG